MESTFQIAAAYIFYSVHRDSQFVLHSAKISFLNLVKNERIIINRIDICFTKKIKLHEL